MNNSGERIFLEVYDPLRIAGMTRRRVGETRIGERVQSIPWQQEDSWGAVMADMPGRYVLLGIPEDIGVRANMGRGGAYSAWIPALNTLLNTQSNKTFTGEEVIVLGHLHCDVLMEEMKALDIAIPEHLQKARSLVEEIDRCLFPVIETLIRAGKEVIVIGGGHNNAYGILRGLSIAMQQQGIAEVGCINCDAHSDLRPLEGRHSGNAFSYALHEGYLQKYAMIGLHEMFNMDSVLEKIDGDERLDATWFEDIFIRETISLKDATEQALHFTKGMPVGLELDLDTVQNIPSSAKTSSGISTIEARRLVHQIALKANVKYFHLAEAAPVLSHIKTDLKTGKLMAYLITDYIKARNQFNQL